VRRHQQGLRVLGPADLPDVSRVLAEDPVTNVFVDSRVRLTGLDPRWLGGEVWGYDENDELVSLCHSAANLAPVATSGPALRAFAAHALRQGRKCGSIVGRDQEVMALWGLLESQWGPARSLRPRQPFMTLSSPPLVEPSPDVRAARPDELDVLYPACVAMYTEELGVSPELAGGAPAYRARIAQLISRHHAFVHIDDGEVVFKAELGAVTPHAAQLQSVWVNPRWRGQGLAAAGVAAICSVALKFIAPVVCLYVNEHNEPARRAYDRVGFTETTKFATILF
jgi:uncharacterized protein